MEWLTVFPDPRRLLTRDSARAAMGIRVNSHGVETYVSPCRIDPYHIKTPVTYKNVCTC